LHVLSIPDNINAGKVTSVKFITFSNGSTVSNANITLTGAVSASGMTDDNGILELLINPASGGRISVTASKNGYENATSSITAIPVLDISASPASIISGTPTYVTFSVTSMGQPVEGAELNISGAGVSLEGISDSSGQIIKQVNASRTGKIVVTARMAGYADGSTSLTSESQKALNISSSHSKLTVNVPVYVAFTVTAGGSAVNDAVVSLSGAANGSGKTNQDGITVILIKPSTTGTITASASKKGFAGSSIEMKSISAKTLSIASSPTIITAGDPTYVMFTVTSDDDFISGATVTLTGAANGNGITNQNGLVIIQVNSTDSGEIKAYASKTGYTPGVTTLTAVGQPALTISASPSDISNNVPTYVTFTVKSSGSVISGASVSVSGAGISTDGVTNSVGQVTMLLNATESGTIDVTARRAGYTDGVTVITH